MNQMMTPRSQPPAQMKLVPALPSDSLAHDDTTLDRTLMTILFTDVVGSTARAAVLGDARWRDVLIMHERILRREVESAGGRVVKLIGDGSLCTFDRPARAIRCAERVCAAGRDLDLEIRAGLHTGECELIDDDIAGMAVHIAARVSARADGGEVLVSRTVRDLSTGSGISLRPRGALQVQGVPGAWELFAVGERTPTRATSRSSETTAESTMSPGGRYRRDLRLWVNDARTSDAHARNGHVQG